MFSLVGFTYHSLSIDSSIDWCIDRFIDWFMHWLVDWLMHWLMHWSIHWFIDSLIDWLIDWLILGCHIDAVLDRSASARAAVLARPGFDSINSSPEFRLVAVLIIIKRTLLRMEFLHDISTFTVAAVFVFVFINMNLMNVFSVECDRGARIRSWQNRFLFLFFWVCFKFFTSSTHGLFFPSIFLYKGIPRKLKYVDKMNAVFLRQPCYLWESAMGTPWICWTKGVAIIEIRYACCAWPCKWSVCR